MFNIQRDTGYIQTAPTTPDFSDFIATVTTLGTFDGGTVTVPVNNNLLTLALGSRKLQFGSGMVTSQSSYTSSYPTGVYSFHLTDSTNALNPLDDTVDDSLEVFPLVPALTGHRSMRCKITIRPRRW